MQMLIMVAKAIKIRIGIRSYLIASETIVWAAVD